MSDTETPYIGELTRKGLDDLKGRKRRGNEEELRAKDVAGNQLAAKIAENAAKVAENAKVTARVRAAKQVEKDAKAKDPPVERGRLAAKIDGDRNAASAKNIAAMLYARERRAEEVRADAQRQLVHAGQKMARMRGLLCDV
jgi:hypothetical protein